MSTTAWRIYRRRHARVAFTGEGARRFGGRWNSPGNALIYTAESRALAALEMLVHLDAPELLKKYVICGITFDEGLVRQVGARELPSGWNRNPRSPRTRQIGDHWIVSRTSAVLQVPSAIVPTESVFLFNPAHADFGTIRIGDPEPFRFDRRLSE
ncbi:MAG TPA: RES domain-containing protein [Phycisphaerae bacterium]